MGFSYRDKSNDMHNDMFGSGRDFEMRSNFQLDLSRSYHIIIGRGLMRETSWLLNYNPSYIMSEVMLKKQFETKLTIFTFFTPGGQTIDLRSNLTTYLM